MPLMTNIGFLATCRDVGPQSDIHEIRDGAIAWEGELIAWVGRSKEVPERFRSWETIDAGQGMVIPGLVECHTHLAFGGWRADEFEMRSLGKSYAEIARAGGGIRRTVEQTRKASGSELLRMAKSHLREMCRLGITTLEAKSGYGLDRETEIRLLEVYRELGRTQPVRVVPTYLGAHVVPDEYRDERDQYVRFLCEEMIPLVAEQGLAEFCDAFLEETAFTTDECRRVLLAGKRAGLKPKLHADQLSCQQGAELAAELGAVSADHLEHVSETGRKALAESGVVAVLLPLASLYLRQPPANARQLIESQVKVAVSTDFNPGSSPNYHLPLAMTLACTLCRMSPAEALKAATIYAAQAVGREDEIGSLESGKTADFALVDAGDPNDWLCRFQPNACLQTYIGGRRVWMAGEV